NIACVISDFSPEKTAWQQEQTPSLSKPREGVYGPNSPYFSTVYDCGNRIVNQPRSASAHFDRIV
ncbi:MAG: hypothetical protein ACK50J_16855, partial [Planctomyces sp.]